VFGRYGEAYLKSTGASLCTAQRRVMAAIEVCRTAVLGGHLEQCDHCGHQRNAYNSLLGSPSQNEALSLHIELPMRIDLRLPNNFPKEGQAFFHYELKN
jgi:hypothetical protein